jgi:dolichyl-diphosphooligosaccharide--protein glycosyltransferase
MSTESEAVKILRELKADYVLIYVVGTRIQDPQSGGLFYVLGGGGDESKKQWFVRIAGLDITQFMYEDEFTPRPNFWENTLMGKMLPFQLFRYVDPTQQGALVEDYAVGRTAIFTYIEKYSESSKPLKLVYTSPSLTRPMQSSRELFAGVLIYELSG